MTLLRLEWLRLIRTRRLLSLIGIYLFFGFLGPLTARYLGDILDRFGSGEMTVIVPDPVPADGIVQFVSNASQIGILVAVAVAAGALTFDALPEMAVFLRTRVSSASQLVLPRILVVTAAVAGAYILGAATAWYETAVLIGSLPVGGVIGGAVLTVVYLGFAIAVVAAVGSRAGSVLATVGITVVVLLAMPLVAIVDPVARWLPSHLVGSAVDLVTDGSFSDYLGSALVAMTATVALVALTIRTVNTREF